MDAYNKLFERFKDYSEFASDNGFGHLKPYDLIVTYAYVMKTSYDNEAVETITEWAEDNGFGRLSTHAQIAKYAIAKDLAHHADHGTFINPFNGVDYSVPTGWAKQAVEKTVNDIIGFYKFRKENETKACTSRENYNKLTAYFEGYCQNAETFIDNAVKPRAKFADIRAVNDFAKSVVNLTNDLESAIQTANELVKDKKQIEKDFNREKQLLVQRDDRLVRINKNVVKEHNKWATKLGFNPDFDKTYKPGSKLDGLVKGLKFDGAFQPKNPGQLTAYENRLADVQQKEDQILGSLRRAKVELEKLNKAVNAGGFDNAKKAEIQQKITDYNNMLSKQVKLFWAASKNYLTPGAGGNFNNLNTASRSFWNNSTTFTRQFSNLNAAAKFKAEFVNPFDVDGDKISRTFASVAGLNRFKQAVRQIETLQAKFDQATLETRGNIGKLSEAISNSALSGDDKREANGLINNFRATFDMETDLEDVVDEFIRGQNGTTFNDVQNSVNDAIDNIEAFEDDNSRDLNSLLRTARNFVDRTPFEKGVVKTLVALNEGAEDDEKIISGDADGSDLRVTTLVSRGTNLRNFNRMARRDDVQDVVISSVNREKPKANQLVKNVNAGHGNDIYLLNLGTYGSYAKTATIGKQYQQQVFVNGDKYGSNMLIVTVLPEYLKANRKFDVEKKGTDLRVVMIHDKLGKSWFTLRDVFDGNGESSFETIALAPLNKDMTSFDGTAEGLQTLLSDSKINVLQEDGKSYMLAQYAK